MGLLVGFLVTVMGTRVSDFWICRDRGQLPAGSSHTGWGCLWSSWEPIHVFLVIDHRGFRDGTGGLCRSKLCDPHPSHGHWGPIQLIAPCPEAEPVTVACTAAVRGWIVSGGHCSPDETVALFAVCHSGGHLLHPKTWAKSRGLLDAIGAGVDKRSSLWGSSPGRKPYFMFY